MRRALPVQLPLAAALAAAARIASAGDVATDILDTLDLGADSIGTETSAALAVECDVAVAGGLAVVGDAVFSNGIARVAPGGGLDAANPDILWSGREPAWWADYGVLNGEPPNDEAAATAGQLKWIATRARTMLDDAAWSAGGAGDAISNLVESLPSGSNSLAVAAAELKRIARPFAQRCIELHADCAFSNATAVSAALAPGPRDAEIVTVGQVKRLFDFDLSVDSDCNSIPDWWERLHGVFDPDPPGGVPDLGRDTDGDGLPDAREFSLGTDPVSSDTDADGLPDAEELSQRTDPRNPDSDGDGLSDGAEAAWIDRGAPFEWEDLSDATVLASGNLANGILPVGTEPFAFAGLTVTNVSVDVNGRVFLRDVFRTGSVSSSYNNATSSNAVFNANHAVVAGYWTDLALRSAFGSRILAAERSGRPVIRYENVGFATSTTGSVSFQTAVESNAVLVSYAAVSDPRTGKTTTFAAQGPGAAPNLWFGVGHPTLPLAGTAVRYRFGTGSSPLLADTDGDGIPDAEEVARGLHPGKTDTDGDGLPDNWELAAGTDPLDSSGDNGGSGDPDGDGRTNAQERSAGTDAFLADTDGDGIPDGTSAHAWHHNALQASYRHATNLVVFASASVPTNGSACLRIGDLPLVLTNGCSAFELFLPTNQLKAFSLRCTRGASVSLSLSPPPGPGLPGMRSSPVPDWVRSGTVFFLDDPSGAFSGSSVESGSGTLGYPRFSIDPAPDCAEEPCIHAVPGSAEFVVSSDPVSAMSMLDSATGSVFDSVSSGRYRLSVADTPRSIAVGTISIPSSDSAFPDLVLGASIHRCEGLDHVYCPLCAGWGESEPTTIANGPRFRHVGSSDRALFELSSGSPRETVWSVEPSGSGSPTLYTAAGGGTSGKTVSSPGCVWAKAGSSPGVYTIRATNRSCGLSEDTAEFVVGKVQLEAIKFNWDHDHATNDAINVRANHDDAFDLANGEWVRGGQNLPACYVTNVTPVLEARFTVVPDRITSCTLFATGGPFNGVQAANVAFAGGASGFVRLSGAGTTGNLLNRTRYNLKWKTSALNGDGFDDCLFQETQGHVLYAIFGEPLPPWKSNPYGDDQNAWTNALEFAIAMTGAKGKATETNALAAITQHLFSGHGLSYATEDGLPTYIHGFDFFLSGYIAKTGNPHNSRSPTMVNCVDQAVSLSSLGSLLGMPSQAVRMRPFGYLNPVDLIGVGVCNNPFFNDPVYGRPSPMCGTNDIGRSSFGMHAFVQMYNKIFDACAGPALGTRTLSDYFSSVVDVSTLDEESAATSGGIVGNPSSVHSIPKRNLK